VASTGPAGGSVHHISLACADIFSAVAAMRERGVGFVVISATTTKTWRPGRAWTKPL